MNDKYFYECVDCGKTYDSFSIRYLCSECENLNNHNDPPFGILRTIYDYSEIKSRLSKNIFQQLENSKYLDLLPVKSLDSFPFLKTGNTPLYMISSVDNTFPEFDLYLKDDSQNPTFSIKDRASAIVSAFAKENNIDTLVTASIGNAGTSLAGICVSQKQKAVIFVPSSVPKTKLAQLGMYSSQIVPVEDSYDNVFYLSIEAAKKFGWYNFNTAFNPLTIEGGKTVSFEMFSQLNQKLPDRIFIPVGNGVIISGVYKGFEDLMKIGIIDRIPIIVAVQAIASSNIINNIDRKDFVSSKGRTLADSISVNVPKNFRMTKQFILDYNGESISVSDEEIIAASKILSSRTGIFAEPSASAAFAGFLSYYWDGKFEKGSKNVVLLTGSGLKDINAIQRIIDIPEPIKPDINSITNFLTKTRN